MNYFIKSVFLPRVNFAHTPMEKKESYTIEIVSGKNGYVETMGVRQYFYYRVSKTGGPSHSLCFLLKCHLSPHLIYDLLNNPRL